MAGAAKPLAPPAASFEYRLERTPVGVVILDQGRHIIAVNALVRRLLRSGREDPLGASILDVHPSPARAKVRWLIDAAENAVDGTASMVVTTPIGSLVAKVTLLGERGYCMMFHALGDTAMAGAAPSDKPGLLKLPVLCNGATQLVEIDEIACLSAQGHYAEALTRQGRFFCPLSLAELGRRLDATTFVRVHRKHLVNLRRVRSAERQDGRWILVLAEDGTRIPVGRDKVDLMRRLLAV